LISLPPLGELESYSDGACAERLGCSLNLEGAMFTAPLGVPCNRRPGILPPLKATAVPNLRGDVVAREALQGVILQAVAASGLRGRAMPPPGQRQIWPEDRIDGVNLTVCPSLEGVACARSDGRLAGR